MIPSHTALVGVFVWRFKDVVQINNSFFRSYLKHSALPCGFVRDMLKYKPAGDKNASVPTSWLLLPFSAPILLSIDIGISLKTGCGERVKQQTDGQRWPGSCYPVFYSVSLLLHLWRSARLQGLLWNRACLSVTGCVCATPSVGLSSKPSLTVSKENLYKQNYNLFKYR